MAVALDTLLDRKHGEQALLGLDREVLRSVFEGHDLPGYRADQLMRWVYHRGVTGFEQMTDVSKDLRSQLPEWFRIDMPEVAAEQVASDGTRKWMLRLKGGQAVETVFIPEDDRGTLCISSQVGCALDCQFCSTAQGGLNRNMTAAEIVSQVLFAKQALGEYEKGQRIISNVVFMGMGEPLANYHNLLPALKILLDDFGFALSKRRVTVSTSGLVPFIDRLNDEADVALAVSLHAPNNRLRDELVPINRKYPIETLLAACDRYTSGRGRQIQVMYEYVMLNGVNDEASHAAELVKLLRHRPSKVNLIPFNPFPGSDYQRSSNNRVERFSKILRDGGVFCSVRRTRGDDIDAACGQLVGKVESRQSRRLGDVASKIADDGAHLH